MNSNIEDIGCSKELNDIDREVLNKKIRYKTMQTFP